MYLSPTSTSSLGLMTGGEGWQLTRHSSLPSLPRLSPAAPEAGWPVPLFSRHAATRSERTHEFATAAAFDHLQAQAAGCKRGRTPGAAVCLLSAPRCAVQVRPGETAAGRSDFGAGTDRPPRPAAQVGVARQRHRSLPHCGEKDRAAGCATGGPRAGRIAHGKEESHGAPEVWQQYATHPPRAQRCRGEQAACV